MLIMRMDLKLVNVRSVLINGRSNKRKISQIDDRLCENLELNAMENTKFDYIDKHTSIITQRSFKLDVSVKTQNAEPNSICNNDRSQQFHSTEEINVIGSNTAHESKVSPTLSHNSTKSTSHNVLQKLNRTLKVCIEKLPKHVVDDLLAHRYLTKINKLEINTADRSLTNGNCANNNESSQQTKPCYVLLKRLPLESTIKRANKNLETIHNLATTNDAANELQQLSSTEVPLIQTQQNSLRKFLMVSLNHICVNNINNCSNIKTNSKNIEENSLLETHDSSHAASEKTNKSDNKDNKQNLSQQIPDSCSRLPLLQVGKDASSGNRVSEQKDSLDNQKSIRTRHKRPRKALFDKPDSIYITTNNSISKVKTSHSRTSTVDEMDNQNLPRHVRISKHKNPPKINAVNRRNERSWRTVVSRIMVNKLTKNKVIRNTIKSRHRNSKKGLRLRNKETNKLPSNGKASKIQDATRSNNQCANKRKSLLGKFSSQNDSRSTKLTNRTTENQRKILRSRQRAQNLQLETESPVKPQTIDSDLIDSVTTDKMQTDAVNHSDNKENSQLVHYTSPLHLGNQLSDHKSTEEDYKQYHSQSKKNNTSLHNPNQSTASNDLIIKAPESNTETHVETPTELPNISQKTFSNHNNQLSNPIFHSSFPLNGLNDEIKPESETPFNSYFIIDYTCAAYQSQRNCHKLLKTTLRNQFKRNISYDNRIPRIKTNRQCKREHYFNQSQGKPSRNARKQYVMKQNRFQPQTLAALAVQSFFGSKKKV